MSAHLGHQSRSGARRECANWLARQAPERQALHCPNGCCYLGYNGVFPARCDTKFAHLD